VQDHQRLSSDQIEQVAIEFAKTAIFQRIREKGTADMAHSVRHYAAFFFEMFDQFHDDLTGINETR
jgi:hypothetical protein